MKQKRMIAGLLVFLLTVSCCVGTTWVPVRAAEPKQAVEADRYYYGQLTKEAKEFYDAMYQMYKTGVFKTGTGSYDLVSNGHVTQAQLAEYADGNTQLVNTMAAARDAFYADYPDIFYVDFSYLTLRVTRDTAGKYHAYLGPGRDDNYYVKGFKNQEQVEQAIETFDKKAEELAAGARALQIKEGDNKIQQEVKYVHDTLIRNTSYHLEDTCQPENIGHIRTAYGALVQGESVCESYARAFKSVLDRLGIPCVLVQGVYRESEDIVELHMWNYVKIDGSWYAVDATMDDPIVASGAGGKENSYYFLVGEDIMSRNYIPSGEMSECGFSFTYPTLALEGLGLNDVSNHSDLIVKYNENAMFEGVKSGAFVINYKGMGYKKAAAQGKYMLMRFYTYNEEQTKLVSTEWGYMDPNVYGGGAFVDTDTELTLYVPHCLYVEFAVTDRKPRYLTGANSKPEDLLYQGDPFLVEGATGMLYNPSGSYVAPPYVKKITPVVTSRIYMGQTYHVVAVYDDELIKSGPEEPHIEMESTGPTGAQYGKFSNFSFDGKSTVSFDFRPSDMWADESEFYYFHIKGLVGKKSGKIPNDISYFVSDPVACCSMKKAGIDWTLFAKPSLMEEEDLSTKGWQTSDGEAVSDKLKDRIALVVTSPTSKQSDEMMDMLESAYPKEKILQSETYNLKLTVCKKQIVETGDRIRISVGFPKGYGPEHAGTTFKAYHFMRNDAGEVTGVEEIPCIVTQYGLLILCDSFSPFAIAAVADDGSAKTTEKTVILSHNTGGKVSGQDKIFTLKPGESRTLQVAADDGYVIDEISVGSSVQYGAGRTSASVRVDYSDLPDGGSFAEVKFVASSVYEREAALKQSQVRPTAKAAKITMGMTELSVAKGGSFSIVPKITEYEGVHTYQWYKDGKPLPGQTAKNIIITEAAKSDAGAYTLKVTTAVNASSVTAEGTACKVTVTDQARRPETGNGKSALKPAAITLKTRQLTVKEGGSLTIDPTVQEFGGAHLYQWYKDGVSIEGQTEKTLYLKSASKKDAGDYVLVVTTYLGTDCVKAASGTCKVTVASDSASAQEPAVGAVTGLKAVSEKAGSVKLEWQAVPGADGYEALRYDDAKGRYVIAATVKKGVSYTEKGLSGGSARRYKVRAYKVVDGAKFRGKASGAVKIIVKPEALSQVSAVRLSDRMVQISFLPSETAAGYRIYRYNEPEKKFELAYRIQSEKLYAYDKARGKWTYMGKTEQTGDGLLACVLTDADEAQSVQKYRIMAFVAKKGFQTQTGETVTVSVEEEGTDARQAG